MSEHTLELTRHIKAAPERVYAAWLSKEDMAVWMGPSPAGCDVRDLEASVGGTYRFAMLGPEGQEYVVSGTFKELDEPNKIVMTWQWETSMEETNPETIITVTFVEKDGGTEMKFLQENMASAESIMHHNQGWNPSFDKLETVVA